ncbi:MAG: sensor histidine kinase [Selenomonadaceae bacterium]|nr:sensor histidine kinase [Selenomonadaceae bacterium]
MIAAVLMTLINMTGAYLRYLPFRSSLDEEKLGRLKKWYSICAIFSFAINLVIFADGVDYRGYKIGLFVDCLSYFILSMWIIGKKLWQVFVLGMQGLWNFMLHSFSGMILTLTHGGMSEELLPLEMTLFLVMFLALIRVETAFFSKMMPIEGLFNEKMWLVAILPIAIFIGTVLPVVNVTFLATWQGKLSRIFFPVFFFIFYRSTVIFGKAMAENRDLEQKNRVLSIQAASLREENELILKNQDEVSQMKKDLLTNYALLEEMIKDGAIETAKDFIMRQGLKLDATRLKKYSESALLNAAISIYMRRAEKMGIKTICKVDLVEILADESDLAILVSNLLENALKASLKQKNPLRREITMIIRNKGSQNVLEVTNYYDDEINIGESGLPMTEEAGHGLGMSSLELFAKKYGAFYDFSHENGLVTLNVYWQDHL